MENNALMEVKRRFDFHLQPFNPDDSALKIKINGTVERWKNRLSVVYEITGNLSCIHFPVSVKVPERKWLLWEDTCLELFIAPKDSPGYWEFNLSPSGDWNVFRFEDYRNQSHENRMFQETAIQALSFKVRRDSRCFRLCLELDLGKIIPDEVTVEMALCAVIETETWNTSCWALVHGAAKPDFHQRGGFVIKL